MVAIIQNWFSNEFKILGAILVFSWFLQAQTMASTGAIEIDLLGGSPQAPSFKIVSPAIKNSPLFIGPVLSAEENNVTFEKIPDLANPAILKGPFQAGVLGSRKARAKANLDENGSLSSIILINGGADYFGNPAIEIPPPTEGNGTSGEYYSAYAETEKNETTKNITAITILEKGRGYQTPPKISIDGGPYFLKVLDEDSNYSGIFFQIVSNSDYSLELNNSHGYDFSLLFPSGCMVEIFEGWTIGSLFGYESTQLYSDQNQSLADWVYVMKSPNTQEGNASDYIPYYHDGEQWRQVSSPIITANDFGISPDEAVIIARRNEQNVSLVMSGVAAVNPSFWEIPPTGFKKLVCNPYSTSVMLSDLIHNDAITDQNSSSSGHLLLAHNSQDLADNLQVINSTSWSTFWHDGTNLNITKTAKISARPGSGIGGALTSIDFSMSSGIIDSISNPNSGNPVITSAGHGLGNGFLVTISSATGRLTDNNKDQINSSGIVVNDGEGLIVESSTNGIWEITNTTTNTFEIKDCMSNSDFIFNGEALWSTGDPGAGYDTDVALSIIGENGQGAKAVGNVNNGKIVSISLYRGGLFYQKPPVVLVHPGGWRMLGRGNSPINDLSIPSGSGVLIIRKHPHGIFARIPLSPIF